MYSELDKWFGPTEPVECPRTSDSVVPISGIIPGVNSRPGALQKPRRPSQHIGRVAEDTARYILTRVLRATVSKSQVQSVTTPRGTFSRSTDVDFVGSMPILHRGEVIPYPIKVEIKGMTGNTFPFSNISPAERFFFERAAAANNGCLLFLVVWPLKCQDISRKTIECVYIIPFRRWLDTETMLEAQASGNYRGKSLRRKDLALFSDCGILTGDNGRWELVPSHWLRPLLPPR